jgi:hypothetical protein
MLALTCPILFPKPHAQKKQSSLSPTPLATGRAMGRRQCARAPRAVQILASAAILLAILALANTAYQVIRKPTELCLFVGHGLDKEPAETWRQYGPLFRAYSTGTITSELLAALA